MNDDTVVCGFCESRLDEDEELVPLRVGPAPKPKPMSLREAGKQRRGEPNRVAQARLLIDALQDDPIVDLSMHRAVETIGSMGDPTETNTIASSFESNVDHDKVAVELHIQPEFPDIRPSAHVCEVCAEMFRDI